MTWLRCEWVLASWELRKQNPKRNIARSMVHDDTLKTFRFDMFVVFFFEVPESFLLLFCFKFLFGQSIIPSHLLVGQIYGQISRSGQLNFTEETVKVVVSLGEDPKHRGLVRPLVEQLERRMRLLVERDYRSAVASLEGRCQEVLKAFFELVGQEDVEELSDGGVEHDQQFGDKSKNSNPWVTPRDVNHKKTSKIEARQKEMTRSILSGVLKALLNHADSVISTTLQGTIEMDGTGEAVIDSVTQRPRVNERSGIMVRVDERLGTHWKTV